MLHPSSSSSPVEHSYIPTLLFITVMFSTIRVAVASTETPGNNDVFGTPLPLYRSVGLVTYINRVGVFEVQFLLQLKLRVDPVSTETVLLQFLSADDVSNAEAAQT